MNFDNIIEKVGSRNREYERRKETGSFYIPRNPNSAGSFHTLKSFVKNDHLENKGDIEDVLIEVETIESKLREARLKGIPVARINQFREKLISQAVQKVESMKEKNRNNLIQHLDDIAKKNEPKGTTAELLELEKEKLRTKYLDEKFALAEIKSYEREGYCPLRLLALSGISEKVWKRAEEVRKAIPERYSSHEAVKTMRTLDALSDLGIGQIGYRLKQAPEFQNVVTVSDLIDPENTSPDYAEIENMILSK